MRTSPHTTVARSHFSLYLCLPLDCVSISDVAATVAAAAAADVVLVAVVVTQTCAFDRLPCTKQTIGRTHIKATNECVKRMERTEQTDRARKMKNQRRIECVQIERLEFFFSTFFIASTMVTE